MKEKDNNNGPDINKFLNYLDKETADQIRNESTRKKRKHHHKRSKSKDKDSKKSKAKKSVFNDEKFILSGNYNIIKLLGYGTFGEIMLAYDNTARALRAIKFETLLAKNAQLRHEYSIYEQLNIIEEKTSKNKISKEKTISNLDITKFFSGSTNAPSVSQNVNTVSESSQGNSAPTQTSTPSSNGGFSSQGGGSLDIPGFLQK